MTLTSSGNKHNIWNGFNEHSLTISDISFSRYLVDLKEHLSVGPPVYFVVNSSFTLDYSQEDEQSKICGGRGCNKDSLQAQIKLWSKQPSLTRLATPAQSWIDDYFDWMKHCCKRNAKGEFCPPSEDSNGTGSSDEGDDDYGEYGDYGDYGEYDPEQENTTPCEPCLLGTYKRYIASLIVSTYFAE